VQGVLTFSIGEKSQGGPPISSEESKRAPISFSIRSLEEEARRGEIAKSHEAQQKGKRKGSLSKN